MKKKLVGLLIFTLLSFVFVASAQDDYVPGDPLPDAPELAPRGEYAVGVRTLELVDAGRVDLLGATADDPSPLYDRPLVVEVWYPATLADGEEQMTTYADNLGRADNPQTPVRPFEFSGRATRDAAINTDDGPYPLVIVSHGFPGSRYMMSYLTENLASKGYVVAAIAHTDSTFEDTAAFGSTLLNRSMDQLFVLDEMATLSVDGSESFLAGAVNAENTAIVGYSMGGYGALNTAGAGYNSIGAGFGPGENLNVLMRGNETYAEMLDERVQAIIVLAPWGGDLGFIGMSGVALWDEEALADISIPSFWIVGSQDDVAMFEGVQRLFDWAVNSERHLLFYDNALHNVAINPPPAAATDFVDYERYFEPAWDEARINNINQHFITAFLGYHLKGNADYAAYLDVPVADSREAVYAVNDAGEFTEEHTYWQGFIPRTLTGLTLISGE